MGRRSTAWDTLFIAVIACAATGLAHYIAARALDDVSHVIDEIAHVFPARRFASGFHAAVELSRAASSFLGDSPAPWFVEDGAALDSISPGSAPKLGVGLWINPVLHGATVAILAYDANLLRGPRAAKAIAIGYGFCPQALILAASLMSHTLIAFASAIVLATSLRSSRNDHEMPLRVRALIAGAAVGIAICTRPLCGVVLAVAAGLGFALTTPHALWLVQRSRTQRPPSERYVRPTG